MSNATENEKPIGNVAAIIERFGGIRPMATKTGIAATTIQGWKQRNAIPANRRNELIDAANDHGVRLGELLIDIAGDDVGLKNEDAPQQKTNKAAEIKEQQKYDRDVRPANNQSTMIAAGALIAVAALAGAVIAYVPKLSHVQEQESRIQELEQQITAMQDARQSALAAEDARRLQEQMAALENKVGSIASEAKSVVSLAQGLNAGNITERLSSVESNIGSLVSAVKSQNLENLILQFQNMQGSAEGGLQLDTLVSSFLGVAENTSAEDLGNKLAELKNSDPAVAATFKDVAPEDMKAAVMILGMMQLRSSLARDNQSFDKDLALLKNTVAHDNPELLASIDKLAPKAKLGILTPDGLSNQLRAMTGEIVSASLSGEDVSFKDKALSHLGNIVKVEKDGEMVSGTPTQITINAAQKKLNEGDVQGAVTLLQQIQGPAAAKTQPIIDAAQATMLASEVQQKIGVNINKFLSGIKGSLTHKGNAPFIQQHNGADALINKLKSVGADFGGIGQ